MLRLLILGAVVLPALWLFLVDLRTNDQLEDIFAQGMRNDAMLFAERMGFFAEHVLFEDYLRSALEDGQTEATSEVIAYPFVIALTEESVLPGPDQLLPAQALAQVFEDQSPPDALPRNVLMRGYVDSADGPFHFVYMLDQDDSGATVMRGAKIRPEGVQEVVIPAAFARLTEAIAQQRGPDMFPGEIITMQVNTPDTTLQLSEMAPDLAADTEAIDAMEGQFDLGGLFPNWTLRVACFNEMKATQGQRYAGTILPLILLLLGIFVTARLAMREVELSDAKTSFVSNVSHELKTPLAKIRFFNDLLQRLPAEAQTKHQRYHGAIDQECTRLTLLIDNVLDFNRIERGQQQYQFEETPVADVVRETVETFRVLHGAQGYPIDLHLDEDLPTLSLDAVALRQALLNLLDNAVKYSEPHTLQVAATHETVDGKPVVALSVADEGIGIPADKLKHIFDEFYRVDTGLAQRSAGSGLGLALVQHVVEAHHGTILAESEENVGSKFTIRLPAA